MRWILSFFAVSVVLPGCVGSQRLATPDITPPYGSVERQQARAEIHEPFPDNDMGPAVMGGRPREYQDPRAEVTRALQRPGDVGLAPCLQSQMMPPPVVQPPIVTAPPAIYYPPATAQP
jgi:hypothetical protein